MSTSLTNWAILFILASEVLLFSRLEKAFYGSWITPFNILAFPYCIVVVLAFTFANPLDFIPLNMESVIIWIVGLFVFWLGSLLNKLITGNKILLSLKNKNRLPSNADSAKIPLFLSWISIFVMSYGLVTILRKEGLLYLTSDDFQAHFAEGWYG